MDREQTLDALMDNLKLTFHDKRLFRKALIDPSSQFEKKLCDGDNCRLAYLGDAVLELVAREHVLKRRKGVSRTNRSVSDLVSNQTLWRFGSSLGLAPHIAANNHVKGRLMADEYCKRLSDAVEALIGAIYSDQGLESARNFIMRMIAMTS